VALLHKLLKLLPIFETSQSQTNQTDGSTGPPDIVARGARPGAILERCVGETFRRPAVPATSRPFTAL
jgi:hypothetical protein